MADQINVADQPLIEVSIAAAPAELWRALRDPTVIRRWHGWDFDGLDEEIRTIFLTGVTEDPDALAFQIHGGDRFSLHPAGDVTVVRITRGPREADSEWAAYYDDITEGWRTFAEQLRFAVERHDLAERRTVVFDGVLADSQPPAKALGLAAVAGLPVGSAYRAEAATGDELQGRVWYRSDAQLGLTVDGAGDGLLVLALQPDGEHRPTGGALVLLTTYGLDGDTFTALQARWTAWWNEVSRSPHP